MCRSGPREIEERRLNAKNDQEEPRKIWDAGTMNAPWGIVTRLALAANAVRFFNPTRYAESCETIGKNPEPRQALSLLEFVRYLEKKRVFGDRRPNLLRVADILGAMAREGILQNVGSYAGKARFFNDCFLFMYAGSQNADRVAGQLWLARALGPELIYYVVGNGVVQITGRNDQGDVAAGSGIILLERTVLTARHVVDDLEVDRTQHFQGVECALRDDMIRRHASEDIATISLDRSLSPVNGLLLHPPQVGNTVHVLGYPPIPLASDPALVMHSGEVTNQSVALLSGESAFLYSAVTRPGNSGGPIVSRDGYLVGMATRDLTVEREGSVFAPHYAGVDAITIVGALADLGIDVRTAFEPVE